MIWPDSASRQYSHQRWIVSISLLFATVAFSTLAYCQQPPSSTQALIRHAITASPEQPFTFDPSSLRGSLKDLPIGVFDSGIGGLTVMEAILAQDQFNNDTLQPKPDGKPDFSGEKFIYFGDQANMPYGNYAAAGKEDYLRELILKDAIFLLGKRYWQPSKASPGSSENRFVRNFDKPPVKAIVIACNTATAYGLDDIKTAIKQWNIPIVVVGVVEAGARGVLELCTQESQRQTSIAVLATLGTCSSGAYPKMIQSTLGRAGHRVPDIVQQGFVELAAAIEGDSSVASQGSIDDFLLRDLRKMLDDYRSSGATKPIGTIVLGCTHYPLVQSEILSTLSQLKNAQVDGNKPFESLIADKVDFVNPAELTAKELFRELARNQLRSSTTGANQTAQADSISVRFFMSIANPADADVQLNAEGNLDQQYKYSRSASQLQVEDTINVQMEARLLPPSSLTLMKTRLPHVWKCFQAIPQ